MLNDVRTCKYELPTFLMSLSAAVTVGKSLWNGECNNGNLLTTKPPFHVNQLINHQCLTSSDP